MVKADAYGHGSVPIALALEAAGADALSVATFDEAVELRDAGLALPLLVLYPVPVEQVPVAIARRIELTVGSGPLTARTLAAAAAYAGAELLAIHLEVETGLGRGGVLPVDAAAMAAEISAAPGVRLVGSWTHLAAADDTASALAQDALFDAALGPVADVAGFGPRGVRRHLAGSGGILGADTGRWDAVRPGLSIYGLVPDALTPPSATAEAASALRPVLSLLARPVRVMELPAGHGVSYGPSFRAPRASRIATLPLGYGDGWRRALSDRAWALVRGFRVPIVGRVAMDAIMADVTDVPGPPVTEDAEFVLLGGQGVERITAHELAATVGTISYEIVTGMSRRLPRVYHAAGSPVEIRVLAGGRTD